jgi:hypothetical protein
MHTTIESRVSSLSTRIRNSHCSRDVAALVRTMTGRRDVEAIPALIALLDLPSEHVGSVERALVRFGEAAEDSLKAYAATQDGAARDTAIQLLSRIAYRARLRQLGCF